MTDPAHRRLPIPVAQAFVVCREIFRDGRTGEVLLLGPTSHVPLAQFPAQVRLSVYVQLTGGHGSYDLRLCLRDAAEDAVWEWDSPEPLRHPDPLMAHQVVLHDLVVSVPRIGKYSFVVLANGEEFAQQSFWFGPAEAFRS